MRNETFGDHPILPLDPGWHAVLLTRDLPEGVALPVVLAGREIVVWRGAGGGLRAWVDRCPHRGMRLSLGFVRGDTLACLYHGWRYRGSDGGCDHIPAHPEVTPPKTIATEAYAVAEADGLVWLSLDAAPGPLPAPAGPQPRAGAASLTVDVPAARARAALDEADGVRVAVQPVLEARCRLHVTAPSDRLRSAVDAAEALRRRLEATPADRRTGP